MSLPSTARRRWGLDDGGDVSYLDLGEAILIVPGGTAALRHRFLDAVTDDDWDRVRRGTEDGDLANQ
jgi:hypothetical protein